MNAIPGTFEVVGNSGVPVMHAALLPNGRVVFIDKVENYTELTLPNGRFAYAAEWDPSHNNLSALSMKSPENGQWEDVISGGVQVQKWAAGLSFIWHHVISW